MVLAVQVAVQTRVNIQVCVTVGEDMLVKQKVSDCILRLGIHSDVLLNLCILKGVVLNCRKCIKKLRICSKMSSPFSITPDYLVLEAED